MVKEFELDPLAEVWIFLDASRTVHSSLPYQHPEFDPRDFWRARFQFKLPPSTVEYCVTVAASLARYYLQRGRALLGWSLPARLFKSCLRTGAVGS